jgi:hypothetical protein
MAQLNFNVLGQSLHTAAQNFTITEAEIANFQNLPVSQTPYFPTFRHSAHFYQFKSQKYKKSAFNHFPH